MAEERALYWGLVIPADGGEPVRDIAVPTGDYGGLRTLQDAVGGFIEAVGLPRRVDPEGTATAIVNEEGKLERLKANMRATDLLLGGIGWGDHIAGDMVVIGFHAASGEHRDLPQ